MTRPVPVYVVRLDTPRGRGALEVPTYLEAAAAGRRAIVVAWMLRWGDIDEITIAGIELLLPYAAIVHALASTIGTPVEGIAGGSIELWATTPDGRVIAVGPDDGPWRPAADGTVTLTRFEVAVYRSAEDYLDGADPDDQNQAEPTIEALSITLTALRDQTAAD